MRQNQMCNNIQARFLFFFIYRLVKPILLLSFRLIRVKPWFHTPLEQGLKR